MTKAILLLATLTFTATSWYFPNFNSHATHVDECAHEKCWVHSNTSFCNLTEHTVENQAAFGTDMGKGIKEKQLLEPNYRIKTIVIDPGHGGYDSGCLGANSKEKHIALGIAKRLAATIQENYPNVKVILTRSTDKFIALHERAAIANKNQADLFLSLHCNYIRNASFVKGSETYVLGLHKADENLAVAKRENSAILLEDNYKEIYNFDPESTEGHIMLSMFQNAYLERSIQFAQKVEDKMATSANRRSRGVKQAGFVVLHQTTMPSVLIETGFLSNSLEEKFLLTGTGQQKIAGAIFQAFREYKWEVETDKITNETAPPFAMKLPNMISAKEEVVTVRKAPSKASQPKNVAPDPMPTESNWEPFPGNSKASTIKFHIQLAASPRPLNIQEGRWSKIDYLIEVIQEDGMYKYQIPRFTTFEEANQTRGKLRPFGFSDAFIVAYKNGEKMNVLKAKEEVARR